MSRVTTACIMALAATTALLLPAAAEAQKPPVEAFGNLPLIDDIAVSPGGTNLATLRRSEGRLIAVIEHKFRTQNKPRAFDFDEGSIEEIAWANDDRLLIRVEQVIRAGRQARGFRIGGRRRTFTRVISVSASTGKMLTLFRKKLPHEPHTVIQLGSWISGWLPGDPAHVLMEFVDSDGAWSLYKVNVNNGDSSRLAKGADHTISWKADSTGRRLLRRDARQHSGEARWLYRLPGGEWETLLEYNLGGGIDFVPLAFAEAPETLYVKALKGGFEAIFEYNLQTKKMGRLVFAHDQSDVRLQIDRLSGKLLAAHFTVHRPGIHYFDAGYAALQSKINQTFRNTPVNRVISSTRDRTAHIISISGPSAPARFFYFNVPEKKAVELGRAYPDLANVKLGTVRMLTYKARDGQTIPAYLTLPPGMQAKNLPTVILPHGGPQSRDTMTFDYQAQFLANRGYAVLQPQFRGSSGFGEKFEEAGEQEWGGLMQDDVTDGVKHLIAEGIADPKRICIMGASYGGYAALMGAVKTPNLYKCAISVAAVTDLERMLKDEGPGLAIHYWKRHIGNPDDSRSPARQAGKIRIPVLLIHGQDDLVVPFEHSKIMARQLSQAGIPHKLVPLKGEDHYMTFGKTRIAMLREAEAFLAEHLGAGTR